MSLRTRKKARHGFVMAMSLALIAVSALFLAGLARRSLELSVQAATAQEDLQRRWGGLSCQRVLLAHAEELLESHAESATRGETAWPQPGVVLVELQLGELHFLAHVCDENAKANLNTMYRRNPGATRSLLEQATQRPMSYGSGPRLNILESPSPTDHTPFQSWGQVFDLTATDRPSLLASTLGDVTRDVTCWGSGLLNVRRASDAAVQMICQGRVPDDVIRKVLAARQADPPTDLDALLNRLALPNRQIGALRQLLTDTSQCHAVWIVVRSSRRSWTSLAIDRPTPAGKNELLVFRW